MKIVFCPNDAERVVSLKQFIEKFPFYHRALINLSIGENDLQAKIKILE